jgi:hypothetical protein
LYLRNESVLINGVKEAVKLATGKALLTF